MAKLKPVEMPQCKPQLETGILSFLDKHRHQMESYELIVELGEINIRIKRIPQQTPDIKEFL